jgi:hypothetical protein
MFLVAVRHAILEVCINTIFTHLENNFSKPEDISMREFSESSESTQNSYLNTMVSVYKSIAPNGATKDSVLTLVDEYRCMGLNIDACFFIKQAVGEIIK